MDRELKVGQLKWPLCVLDEVIVAPCAVVLSSLL